MKLLMDFIQERTEIKFQKYLLELYTEEVVML